ncbi:hydantoinase/oxoprolinase family protein [Saccharopolyspora sp. ASAGF58]|uniref:hydantoinase/oxoprolinase family protein n=1 Tax=Saccharopolyspora sp. ASAGF58 TaxID=2719023 RepID=UPI001446412B|nr:hydantoinase/oxoprolinase family protein [Saccharopolyspora sp. ASAGF58]
MVESDSQSRAAADVGGTFIDFVAVDSATGRVSFDKQPASSGKLVEEFMAGLSNMGLPGITISQLFHGTTVAINAVVQERGARVGLVTTAGFRDVLELGRGARPEVYNYRYAPPAPLVPRHLRLEVTERILPTGEVLMPLAIDEVDAIAATLKESDVEAVAVCLLHAYANPAHEQALVEALRASLPGVAVTASHEIASEWHEFERTSSTVMNAYVQPLFGRYVKELTARLAEDGYRAPLGIMQSNGGVLSAERAAELPLRTLMSGPAGGVVASRELAREHGIEHAICADVGGTTFDVALVVDGDLVERTETKLGGRPVLGATVDITSVGAGGGSIAWVDDRGALKVGPRSAGAVPGPVCFGKGGVEPTVTDAQVLLRLLDPDQFLGGRMKLDRSAAEEAVQERVAAPLGLELMAAALGIVRIAETNMANAVRAVTVGRGLDPRDFALISYGGGGGLFAAPVADELGVTHVVVPVAAASFSAWGILSSDYTEDATRTRIMPLSPANSATIEQVLRELAEDVTSGLSGYGFSGDLLQVQYGADVRFVGQHHTVTVPVESTWLGEPDALTGGVERAFRALHDRMYGPRTQYSVLEIVTLRARGTVTVAKPKLPLLEARAEAAPLGTRDVYFASGVAQTQLYDRLQIANGQRIPGPALVLEWGTTTLVPAGWSATHDESGNLHLTSTRHTDNSGARR